MENIYAIGAFSEKSSSCKAIMIKRAFVFHLLSNSQENNNTHELYQWLYAENDNLSSVVDTTVQSMKLPQEHAATIAARLTSKSLVSVA
jgi:hypothetical protein